MKSEASKWSILAFTALAFLLAAEVALLLMGSMSQVGLLLTLGLTILVAVSVVLLIRSGRNNEEQAMSLLRLQEAMADENQRHRDALDQFASGLEVSIFIVDPKLNIRYANRLASEIFGQPPDSESTLLSLSLSHDLESLAKKAIESAQPQTQDITFHRPQFRICQVRVWVEPPLMDRVFITLYDQTQIKRLERMRRDFVANVSHELRTPMATVRVMAETLRDEEKPDPALQHRYLSRIINEVDRLASVTKDLLTLSMVESQTVRKEPIDIAHLVKENVEISKPSAQAKKLQLETSIPASIRMDGNPGLLSQVIVNLVANAIAYTQKGQINVTLFEDDGWAVLEVRDTGIGIASEHQPRIFERFYRVDKGRSRATGGTGLGLAIVRNIVESHGGRIFVESALNVGSTFRVELPMEAP